MPGRFRSEPDRPRIRFHHLREQRWNKRAIWRYLALLIVIIFLLKFLRSV
ncbi:MAG: hypothetical protein IID13_06975 [Candidatus Marinimicrobia bacterium]|nr:hypothetical protein [Candidatus Neomarinimicrobiota bacterium]MCH7851909.1 hypothetical protein [Candidatus Neomarinimicrobiota bacterium]MCH7939471.1 hypothetical protein [Candidatus Neomarinimicrobiota bacterium]MCH8024620.1 hypothetical protein [Candidatus Neomarinimicrobiota bacterium]MCH8838415.1 hypothetical protein [Candidatus Neomarinimicrobiota bacterium]